jgi:CrcB protein
MTPIVLGLGGALGALARYYGTEFVRRLVGNSLPWGTLAVNIIGAFALGFLMVWLQSRAPSTQIRQFIGIGFLGSFTTFSTFSYETVALAREGHFWHASGYAASSVVLGIFALVLGALIASTLSSSGN